MELDNSLSNASMSIKFRLAPPFELTESVLPATEDRPGIPDKASTVEPEPAQPLNKAATLTLNNTGLIFKIKLSLRVIEQGD
jgi:hypothetical protein